MQRISLHVQRNFMQLQEQKFLTSGVKAHLGGLGGKWAVASDNILPFNTFSLYMFNLKVIYNWNLIIIMTNNFKSE